MEKSVEGSCLDQHGCKDESRTSKKRSVASSPRRGAARGINREKQPSLGDQLDKSQQTNPTQVSKPQPVTVTKRKIQKTAAPGPKAPSIYNLRSRDQKTEGAKDPPAYNLRRKVQKTEGENTSKVVQERKTRKKDGSKDSSAAIQRRGISKPELRRTHPECSEPAIKKIGTTKPLTISLADHDKKNQPFSGPFELSFHDPIYHIRWEGYDTENGPFGQNCMLCNKDLSGATEDDDDSEYDDHFQYGDDDDDDDDEYYDDDVAPALLPAVDILACGHAYHTECLQQRTPEEQSSDPKCVLCSKMA